MASKNEAPGTASGEPGLRRERMNVASQACDTCRTRKTKCDEQRPACGLCRRLNLECVYRETVPTKKDKTMVHILESLARLELKVDRAIGSSEKATPESSISGPSPGSAAQPALHDQRNPYEHVTPPHKVILWPSVYIFLSSTKNFAATDTQNILQQGTGWFVRQELAMQKNDFDHASQSTPETLLYGASELCDAYFENFNVLAPILDKDHFIKHIMSPCIRAGCRGNDVNTVMTYVVLALGHLARQGVHGEPVSRHGNTSSGFRGGTINRPPGLDQFNEARKRLGFVITQISLEVVQVMLLMATYYEASARHLDFWKSATSASSTCQALIRGQAIDWDDAEGSAVKRAYWACLLNEILYHHDLDFPPSGIQNFDDIVPIPSYYDKMGNADANDRSEYQRHFIAMVTLRRVISLIHDKIHKSSSDREVWLGEGNGPRFETAREMADQLQDWRNTLPGPLQWQDNDRLGYPHIGPPNRRPTEPLFAADQPTSHASQRHNIDVMTAQLRTRYYYARFMIYRPFIWRALHVEESMTAEDDDLCALAIKSALLWPIFMAPPKNKKRLVPHHFTWTQNLIGILLIFRMRFESACLKRICDTLVNQEDLQRSTGLMLEWIRDMAQFDGMAKWGWTVLEPLYT